MCSDFTTREGEDIEALDSIHIVVQATKGRACIMHSRKTGSLFCLFQIVVL